MHSKRPSYHDHRYLKCITQKGSIRPNHKNTECYRKIHVKYTKIYIKISISVLLWNIYVQTLITLAGSFNVTRSYMS